MQNLTANKPIPKDDGTLPNLPVLNMSTEGMIEGFTKEFCVGMLYENSTIKKLLLNEGKKIIPLIGKFLLRMKKHPTSLEKTCKKEIEFGWRDLVIELMSKEGIEPKMILGNNDDVIKFTTNYKP